SKKISYTIIHNSKFSTLNSNHEHHLYFMASPDEKIQEIRSKNGVKPCSTTRIFFDAGFWFQCIVSAGRSRQLYTIHSAGCDCTNHFVYFYFLGRKYHVG